MKRWQPVVLGVAIALILGVVALLFVGPQTMQPDWPGPLDNGKLYVGGDAAELTVEVRPEGCCYVEGALRFLELEGPWSGEWQAGERETLTLPPGRYLLTAYERGCNGNCNPGFVGPPDGFCSEPVDLRAGAGSEIVVTFPIPQACTTTVVTNP